MPQLATITINDGASTPVAHAFAPVTTDGQYAQLAERTSVMLANPKLNVRVRPPVSGGDQYKVVLTISQPTVVTVDGVATVDYVSTGEISMSFSNRTTTQNRKDLRVLLANALNNATLTSVIEQLEPLF